MRVLYVGCGDDRETTWLPTDAVVTRLDLDPECEPDIVADMRDMGDIGEYDMVFSCHSLEHLRPHEVGQAVQEFYRVLSPQGYAVILVPDLEDVRPTLDILYESPAGPITGLDIIYGHHVAMASMPYMAHHTGFIEKTLREALNIFPNVVTKRMETYNLLAIARKE